MANSCKFTQMKILSFIIIGLLFLSCNCNTTSKPFTDDGNYFTSISRNDIKLEDPLPGDWRAEHNEAHQSFDDYKKLAPQKAVPGKTKLYLLPLGSFSALQLKAIELTREYLELFFQLKTEILKPVSDHIIPDSAKRLRYGNIQLHTPYIFEHLLKGKMAPDCYALMAISEKDLYPDPTWNFVFGMASYEDRIGVTSMFRYLGTGLTNDNFPLCLKRLIATASHEIGHMFSIRHCVAAKCTMNGSNSLPESDRQPLRLCSECQQKLNWNIGYDNNKRLRDLIDYLKRNQLQEDLLYLEKDMKGGEGTKQ
jgi:archaemetzincin